MLNLDFNKIKEVAINAPVGVYCVVRDYGPIVIGYLVDEGKRNLGSKHNTSLVEDDKAVNDDHPSDSKNESLVDNMYQKRKEEVNQYIQRRKNLLETATGAIGMSISSVSKFGNLFQKRGAEDIQEIKYKIKGEQ